MLDRTLRSIMERKKLVTATPQTTVREAAKLMASRNVGAVMVLHENGRLAGIFTERDAVFRVIAKGLDFKTTTLEQVMTPSPIAMGPQFSYGHALVVMQENGFRHVPVVNEDNLPIGIVSSRNAMDPDLEEFVFEERRRKFHSVVNDRRRMNAGPHLRRGANS